MDKKEKTNELLGAKTGGERANLRKVENKWISRV